MHDIWGPIRTMYRGWSTDEALRFHAAAGGAMTALGCFILEAGKADAILHVRASREHPTLTDALVSRTPEEVRSGAQSRYGPAAPLRHVMALLDEGLRFAVLAKPCDVGAIRRLARIDPRVEDQVPYLITTFCGGANDLDAGAPHRRLARRRRGRDRHLPLARQRLARADPYRDQGRPPFRPEL